MRGEEFCSLLSDHGKLEEEGREGGSNKRLLIPTQKTMIDQAVKCGVIAPPETCMTRASWHLQRIETGRLSEDNRKTTRPHLNTSCKHILRTKRKRAEKMTMAVDRRSPYPDEAGGMIRGGVGRKSGNFFAPYLGTWQAVG